MSNGYAGKEEAIVIEDSARLLRMVDELRSMRENCEPKSPENPRYHRYSLAISALNWLVSHPDQPSY